MYGYAINGTAIVATKEVAPGSAGLLEGSLVCKNGELEFQYEGGTTFDYDAQQTVEVNGETMFYDENSDEWPGCSIVLLPAPLGLIEDETDPDYGEPKPLPADLLATASAAYDEWTNAQQVRRDVTYTITAPKGGFRDVSTFTDEEKKSLRPVAETLALLDGNAFFGATRNESGDDTFYEQYLPEAAALVAANGGWSSLTSFARGDTPLPDNIFAGILQDEPHVLDLCEIGQGVRVSITGIEWDFSDEDGTTSSVKLPTDLEVNAPADWAEDGRLADLLADQFGFCVSNYANAIQVSGE